MQWSEESPGDGDLSGLARIGEFLGVAGERVWFLTMSLERWGSDLGPRAWSGAGRRAWDEQANVEYARLRALPAVFGDLVGLIGEYRSVVEGIASEVAAQYRVLGAIEASVDGCDAVRFRSAGMWSTAWCEWSGVQDLVVAAGAGAGVVLASPALPCSHASGEPRWGIRDGLEGDAWAAFVTEEVSWHREAILALGERRRGADERLAQGLRAALPGSWAGERAAYESAGITEPRLMVPVRGAVGESSLEVVLSQAAGVTGAMLAHRLQGEGLNQTQRTLLAQDLAEATAGREQDVAFWTAFFGAFPPESLPAVMIATLPSEARLDFGGGAVSVAGNEAFADVRAGLVLFAGTLPYPEQSRLGRDLTAAAMGEGRFGGRALWYLMQYPGLPGGVYAGAMVELDVLERVQGKQWEDELPLGDGTSPIFTGLVSADPAVTVLAGLVRHPEAALDFFGPHTTPGGDVPVAVDVSTARVGYWVGERAYDDDLTAVSAAIAAATVLPANTQVSEPAPGAAPDTTARELRAAWTLSAVSGVIDERTDLDHMSEDAALSLTAAFAPHAAQGFAQVPGLERDEHGRMQHETEDFTAGVERISAEARYAELTDGEDATGLGELPAGCVPRISYEGLEAVAGATTRHDAAFLTWMVGTTDEREHLFDLAFSEDPDLLLSAADRRALIEQGVEGQGAVVGMAEKAAIERGMAHDAVVARTSNAVTASTGWIQGGGLLRPIIDYGLGEAVGSVTGANSQAYTAAVESDRAMLSVWDDAYASLEARVTAQPGSSTHRVQEVDPWLRDLTGHVADDYEEEYLDMYRRVSKLGAEAYQ